MKVRIVIAGIIAATLAGCTSVKSGQPSPQVQSSGSSPPSSIDQTYGAPRVSNPLDASRFLAQPCDVLTTAQVTTFGVSRPGIPDTDGEIAKRAGPGCIWHAEPEVNSSIDVGFLTGNKHGLSDTYRGRDRFKFFEETTVDGYPAVFNDFDDRRFSGYCNITVGITDTLTFRAGEQGGFNGQAACDRVKQVAAAVIVTLKAGG